MWEQNELFLTPPYIPFCDTSATHHFFLISVAKFLFGEWLRKTATYPTSHEPFILSHKGMGSRLLCGGLQELTGSLLVVVAGRNGRVTSTLLQQQLLLI